METDLFRYMLAQVDVALAMPGTQAGDRILKHLIRNNLGPLLTLFLALLIGSCSTVGYFKIPEGTRLEVYERPVKLKSGGRVETSPFFWTAAGVPPGGGVPYRLLKGTKVVKEGRLRAKFRVVSIFWPPFALIYWPMGLNPDITYDLVKNTQD